MARVLLDREAKCQKAKEVWSTARHLWNYRAWHLDEVGSEGRRGERLRVEV